MNKNTFITLLLGFLITTSCEPSRMISSPVSDNKVQKKEIFNPSKRALVFYFNKLFDLSFESYDLNKDLQLTLSEFSSNYGQVSDFNKMDKNQDGIVTKEEATFNKDLLAGKTIDEHKESFIKMIKEFFEKDDKDKNGFLSKNEYLKNYENAKYAEQLFIFSDKNKDNKITLIEKLDESFSYYELFTKFDENHDEIISKNEFFNNLLDKNKEVIYIKFDKNKNSKLDNTEFMEYYKYIISNY